LTSAPNRAAPLSPLLVASAHVRDLSVRAKDLLERAKLLLWGANRIGDRGRIAPAQILSLVEHVPEQHPLLLAVAAGIVAVRRRSAGLPHYGLAPLRSQGRQMFGAKQQAARGGQCD
jgi:hypothetical protein